MFDPYLKWLGIPKDQRPVDHFLLLDIDPDETDPDVIRKAAKRQVARVLPYQDGPHAEDVDRLLEEIADARDALLKPAKLKRTGITAKASSKKSVEEEEPEEESPPPRSDKGKNKGKGKSSRKTKQPEQQSRVLLWVSLSAAALLLLGGGVTAFVMTRPKKTDTPSTPAPVAAAPQTPVPPPTNNTPKTPPKEEKPPPKVEKPPVVVKPPAAPPLSRPPVRKHPPSVVKLAVPDQAAQDKAEKALKETYKADYAKTKPEDSLALACKLLQPGRENRADPAAWFVLLREAREAAVRAGRSRLAVEAITEIDKWFIIDATAMKVQAVTAVSELPEGGAAAVKTALAQVGPALAEDNYAAALRLLDAADAAARKGKVVDDKQVGAIAARRAKVQAYEKAYQPVAAARKKLMTMPDDADANQIVGRHLCIFQGRWDEGLPLLAKGGDEAAKFARQDLTPPADLSAQTAVGDGWWQLGEKNSGRDKRHIRERSLAWYQLAFPKLLGEEQARLAERIVAVLKSGLARIPRLAPGSFMDRLDIEDRTLLLREGGGNMKTEEAIENGLAWLSKHQFRDGRWTTHLFHKAGKCTCTEPGEQFDVAGTAFGLLPFLGAGETHKRGRYMLNVKRGLRFLLEQQQKKKEGNFSDSAYENALATIAVCEAYGQTKDKTLALPAQLAVNFIVKGQNRQGGWGYTPGAEKGDTSVSGWQFSALKAGYFAGLSVPAESFARMASFLNFVADPSGLGYGYNGPGAGRATSATGLLCREFLGLSPTHPALAKGIEQLLKPENFVTKEKPSIYFVFYATQVMHHAGGEAWETWNPKCRDLLLDLQDQGKEPGLLHQKGSFSPRGDDWAKQGGRLMFTSLALLTLEVYYYHIPLNGFGPAVLQE